MDSFNHVLQTVTQKTDRRIDQKNQIQINSKVYTTYTYTSIG